MIYYENRSHSKRLLALYCIFNEDSIDKLKYVCFV